MTDNKFTAEFLGVPKLDAELQLMAIVADTSTMKSSISMQNTQLALQNDNVNRRLTSIETTINKIQSLTESVLSLQGQLQSHTRAIDAVAQWRTVVDGKLDNMADHNSRLRECEVRCESINHNGEVIFGHEMRLVRIEKIHTSFLTAIKSSVIWLIGIAATFGVAILAAKLHIDISTIEHISNIFK